MSYNQDIYDRVVQHLADTRLYEAETHGNVSSVVKRHNMRIADLLAKNLKSDLKPEVTRVAKELHTVSSTAIAEYGGASVDFHVNNISRQVGIFYSVKKPQGFDVLKEIIGDNVGTTRSLEKSFNAIGTQALVRLQQTIARGIVDKKSQEDIIADAIKTTGMTENQTRALVRTSLTRTQAVALDKVMTANADILKGYRFTAVLDAKTSATCSSLDGKVFPLTEIRYRPPLHWNCRSSLVPVLLSKEDMLQVDSSRLNKARLAEVKPVELQGDVPKVEDYDVWLRRQPMDVKVTHLGSEEKVALFEKGTLKVKEFFTAAGNQISISTLRRLDNKRTVTVSAVQAAKVGGEGFTIRASKPYDLLRSAQAQDDLRAMLIADAASANQALALVDYKGTSIKGKRMSRMSANNVFDERSSSWDPFTGEVKNSWLYDPDFGVYQERRDFLTASKLLTKDQKDFIFNFADSLEDKISVNQQSVVVENLRVVFERYAKDKKQWDNPVNVLRNEAQFSTVNVSRILDRRSRDRADLYSKYLSGEEPKVQIFGEYFTFSDLSENQLSNQRAIDSWVNTIGREKARDAFYSKQTPLKQFLFDPEKAPDKWQKRLKKFIEDEVPGVKMIKDWDKPNPSESMLQKASRQLREEYRNIVDLEFLYQNSKKGGIHSIASKMFVGSTKGKDFADQLKSNVLNDAKGIDVFAKIMNLIADGKSTDYDSLAINIGKTINEQWPSKNPFGSVTIKDNHESGSRILEALRSQKKLQVVSRGVVRRAAMDIDTGRPSGAWADTVSREVVILDKDMKKLQSMNRQNIIAGRLGVVRDRDRLYVRPGEKTYFDARGNNTGQTIITRRASGNYDKLIVDRDFADMLNHTMSAEYQTDQEFAGFMDEIVRFRDPRGNVQKYDDLNSFRQLILKRGDQGFGFMQAVRWHNQRGGPFKVIAQIDGRGRVYYQGFLTPTGGEVVRPFLNSGVPRQFGQVELHELSIQIGAMLGPATEALTQAGRMEIFLRNEKDVRSLGELLMSKTQRDRRLREFLEHPIIRAHDAEEVPKITRLALEYARVHGHVGGDFSKLDKSKYMTRLMIENDASSSGAQIIGLSTGDRSISINSNVLATDKKNRLYDLVAMDTASDPEFHAIKALAGANIQWTDLAKAAKAQNMVSL